jgi:hypothetical protein
VGGHLFVLRGDLTSLQCSAVLVPCDNNWEVVWDYWSALLPAQRFERSPWGRRLKGGGGDGRFYDVATSHKRKIRLVVTADGRGKAKWVADGVVEAIESFSHELPIPAGRIKPLVALPLVGTGNGGFEYKRGLLIRALLPRLVKVAQEADIDVALVLRDDRDHTAVQGLRSAQDWHEFGGEHLQIADALGRRAARSELSLFLGAGVSVPLGLPDWQGLLTHVAGKSLRHYSPDKAPQIAQRICDELGADTFYSKVEKELRVFGFAPAHLLLAALAVRQTVTTNFDIAYENALDGTFGADNYRVLTRQLAMQPLPLLLKMNGDVRRPKSIVLTEDAYALLQKKHRALIAVVESLLMTSHLMFVGYRMTDPLFVKAARRVRTVRALAEGESGLDFATVLALHPGTVSPPVGGFSTVSMDEDTDDRKAARLLEIFLDRISWTATREARGAHGYLLDENYRDLSVDDAATTRLQQVLKPLLDLPMDDPARLSGGWPRVQEMLTELGGRQHFV